MISALLTAAWLGILTAISPCPLATNVAAVSYLGRHAAHPTRSLLGGLAYVIGRTTCYTALAALLSYGILRAASASETFNNIVGLLIGPVLMIAGAMVLRIIPAPSFGAANSAWTEKLGRRGDVAGGFVLGVVFALSFCPSSAALFFGSLLPVAAKSNSVLLVPMTYGIATGLPVLVFAIMIATGGHGLGKAFDRLAAIQNALRIITGLLLIGIGLYLCLQTVLVG
jgi:cytochrome c-type biogenesis protein